MPHAGSSHGKVAMPKPLPTAIGIDQIANDRLDQILEDRVAKRSFDQLVKRGAASEVLAKWLTLIPHAEVGPTAKIRAAHPGARFLDAGGRAILPGLHQYAYASLQRVCAGHGAEGRGAGATSRRFWIACGGGWTRR